MDIKWDDVANGRLDELIQQQKKLDLDMVNHPPHYEREGAMECIDEMLLLFDLEEVMAFCKLNAWKYRYRATDKGGNEDIKKSDWYIRKFEELKGFYAKGGII